MTAGGNTDYRPQYVLSWQQRPWTSTWFPAAEQIKDINMVFVLSMDNNMASCGSPAHRQQHDFHQHRPRIPTSKASGISSDNGGLSRRLKPENEPFFNSDILLLLRVRVMLSWAAHLRPGSAGSSGCCAPPCTWHRPRGQLTGMDYRACSLWAALNLGSHCPTLAWC